MGPVYGVVKLALRLDQLEHRRGLMDVERLKHETSAEHDRVEQSMRVMDEHLDTAAYLAILRRLYGFVLGWESWAAQSTCATVQMLLRSRRRSEMLHADLVHFSSKLPSHTYPGPRLSLSSLAQVLGGMYVMEGSTLGGQYIARHVEAILVLSPGSGDAFFRGYGETTGSMWREVKEALVELPDAKTEEVIHAARTLFHDFTEWNEGRFVEPSLEKVLA